MEFDRARLKQDVKLSMKRTSPSPMVVALLFSVVVSVGTWLLNTVLGFLFTGGVSSISDTMLMYIQQGYEVEEAVEQAMLTLLSMGPGAIFGAVVGGMVLSILVSLWQSAMGVGYEGWCLSMVRNEDPLLSKIFCALPQIVPVLITRFLTGLFEMLWVLLLGVAAFVLLVVAALLFSSIEALILLTVLAVYAALILGMVWIFTRYALVDYLLLDKGISGMEAIRESKRLMKGNIGRCFVLQLSFIGWYLLESALVIIPVVVIGVPIALSNSLEVLAGGIAVIALLIVAGAIAAAVLQLWVRPYVTGSMAKFYDWTQGRIGNAGPGPGFGGGEGGWDQPGDYTWNSGSSGPGTGSGSGSGGGLPPRPPRDDPWN